MELLDRALDSAPLAVLDVETTGLWAEQGDRVCELAVLRVEPGAQERRLSTFVDPGRPIHPDASRVNGILDDDVAGAPRFADIAGRLDALLRGAVMVAHNAEFDASFLVAEYAIAGLEVPDIVAIDTLALARRQFRFRHNDLASVAVALGVPLGSQHRAAADVETTYGVVLAMAEQLARRGMTTIADLLAAQGGPATLKPPRLDGLPGPLSSAVEARRPVTICYVDAGGRSSERVVVPLWANRQYLIAFCRTKKAQRTFRIDRIVDAWLS